MQSLVVHVPINVQAKRQSMCMHHQRPLKILCFFSKSISKSKKLFLIVILHAGVFHVLKCELAVLLRENNCFVNICFGQFKYLQHNICRLRDCIKICPNIWHSGSTNSAKHCWKYGIVKVWNFTFLSNKRFDSSCQYCQKAREINSYYWAFYLIFCFNPFYK